GQFWSRFARSSWIQRKAGGRRPPPTGKRHYTEDEMIRSVFAALVFLLAPAIALAQIKNFQVEEASIADIQNAIKSCQTTCRAVVQAYIDRARAYNGVCTALVTQDGAPIPPATGAVRAGAPIVFPTKTVAVTTIFPNFSEYKGLPFEL